MEMKTIITVVIAGMLGALVFGVMLPVFAETTSAETTFTNEGYYRMSHYDANDTDPIVVTWSYDDANYLVVNGVKYDVTGPKNMGLSVIIDTNMLIRAGLGSAGIVANMGYFTPGAITYAEVNNGDSMSITFSNGSYTGTIKNTNVSGTYEDLYIPSMDGNYIMKDMDKGAYLLEDSDIIAYGVTNVKRANNTYLTKGISITGNLNDLVIDVWRGSENFTTSTPTIDKTEVNTYKGLYQLDKITFTGTVSEIVDTETITTDTAITYNYFLVPYEVTAEKVNHPDGPTTALMNLLPILIGIGLVVGIAGVVLARRF